MSQLLTEFPSVYVYKRQRFKPQNFIFSYQKIHLPYADL